MFWSLFLTHLFFTIMQNEKNGKAATIAQNTKEVVEISTAKITNNLKEHRTIKDVFERLEQGQRKKEFYNDFCGKLENVKQFRAKSDGSALVLSIVNIDNDEIIFNNLEMIIKFIDDALLVAEQIKHQKEEELLALSL